MGRAAIEIAAIASVICLGAVAFTVASEVANAAPPAAACLPGKAVSEDTLGHCCWPGQAWSAKKSECIGAPSCPSDLVAEETDCVCAAGKAATAETKQHCCWPDQLWSKGKGACVGEPACESLAKYTDNNRPCVETEFF